MEMRFIALSFDGHTQIWKCYDERTKAVVGIEEREGSTKRFYPTLQSKETTHVHDSSAVLEARKSLQELGQVLRP